MVDHSINANANQKIIYNSFLHSRFWPYSYVLGGYQLDDEYRIGGTL